MGRFSIDKYVTVSLYDFDERKIVEFLEMKGYMCFDSKEVVPGTTTDESINNLLNSDDYLYEEKENIRCFFEQDKFKQIPNNELRQFLNQYK